MKLDFCHTLSTETVQVELPDTFANDLEHVVAIKDGEAYQFKSTIPDDIKKKNSLRQEFEDKEFETLRTQYYSSLNDDSDPDVFEKDFTDRVKALINEKYPDLKNVITDDSIYHTLACHFVPYVIYKNREEKMRALNDAQKSDHCYAKDFAKRLIKLFQSLSFKDPNSILRFKEDLDVIRGFMEHDERRHAGHDKLYSVIVSTVLSMTDAFISKNGEKTLDLVKAFKQTAEREPNPDRDALVEKINTILSSTIESYQKFLKSIEMMETEILSVNADVEVAHLGVIRGIVIGFINDTESFVSETDGCNHDPSTVESLKMKYKQKVDTFVEYLDSVVISFDDLVKNNPPDNKFSKTIEMIYQGVLTAKSSGVETWAWDLAQNFYENYNSLFEGVPTDLKVHARSN